MICRGWEHFKNTPTVPEAVQWDRKTISLGIHGLHPDLQQVTWLGPDEIPIKYKKMMCSNCTAQCPHIHSNVQEKIILAKTAAVGSSRHKEQAYLWLFQH